MGREDHLPPARAPAGAGMSYEARHKVSSAWIRALEWQYTYERWGEREKAAKWAKRADKLKNILLSEAGHV
jgi:hypothetical protein